MRIALTIDLDFFCREMPIWDWGHSELPDRVGIDDVIWMTRYSFPYFDLVAETDIKTHADCFPSQILYKLQEAGYNMNRKTRLGIGWSHSLAYDFFKDMEFDMLLNVDAHHDVFESSQLNCGSWIGKLHDLKPFDYKWVYPKWLESDTIRAIRKKKKFNFDIIGLEKALKLRGDVVGIYIAQSPSWVPPHLNHHIDQLIMCSMLITKKEKIDVDEGLLVRRPVNFKEIAKLREQQRKLHEKHIQELGG